MTNSDAAANAAAFLCDMCSQEVPNFVSAARASLNRQIAANDDPAKVAFYREALSFLPGED